MLAKRRGKGKIGGGNKGEEEMEENKKKKTTMSEEEEEERGKWLILKLSFSSGVRGQFGKYLRP